MIDGILDRLESTMLAALMRATPEQAVGMPISMAAAFAGSHGLTEDDFADLARRAYKRQNEEGEEASG